jgi:hypothetical protein
MQFQPVRALITRDNADDPSHQSLHDVPGMIPREPEVGAPLQLFFDSGTVMRTSTVRHVEHLGSEWVVDTENSRYRLKVAKA